MGGSSSQVIASDGEKKLLDIGYEKTCDCDPSHINCLTPKEWIKAQIGVWRFNYEKRDIRDKRLHPATFPISLAAKVISLFTHRGELVVDPFVGSGTTLVAARDLDRNAVGFDLKKEYIDLCNERLRQLTLTGSSKQLAIQDDARNIPLYFKEEMISLIFTSPPYANLLNRRRRNKSRRGDERKNEQFMKVEQYSQDPRDLGTLSPTEFGKALEEIFGNMLPLLKPKGHCVIDIPDMWWRDKRITLHIIVVEALRKAGYELRNIIIWDRTNIVNRVGIFGWPSNYITMGTTFEYLLHFRRPPKKGEAHILPEWGVLEEKIG
ncbi:TPA: site-specific DNA-methyltransferase [Candidatus Poribacteria bacterium]|nr:site-specific DNA-methyltransferase [Candidatus Poribacteria bacterium]HEX29228.1 site-specific DNA-methyltransferase [Candidatus Poribacteria bacterium]